MMNDRAILLVEDNPMDVDLTKRAFARGKYKYPIEVARDGEEALQLIPQWEANTTRAPRLILLDLKLPKVNGLEVLHTLRAHPRFGRIPVVMLTTSAEDSDVTTAYKLGANSYIVKPVEYERFLEVAAEIERYWGGLNTPNPDL